MNAAAPAAAAPAEAGERRHESLVGVFAVAAGLLAIVGLLAALLVPVGGSVDGPARLGELFAEAGPPFGLELEEAALLTGGEVVLELVRAEGAQDATAPPTRVLLVEYPGAAAVRRLFSAGGDEGPRGRGGRGGGEPFGASARKQAWEKDPSFAWHTTLRREQLVWREWRTLFVVERAFFEGGGWRDSARVDLSQPERQLVLFAEWPDETEASETDLGVLVRSIEMLPPSDTP